MTEQDRTDARRPGPGTARSPVRPYTLTRGRTASREALPPETVVVAADEPAPATVRFPVVPEPAAGELRALAHGMHGPVWLPGDDGFDAEIAASSATVVHRPHAVVGARDADDVAAVVRFAAERSLPVAVQATGHGAVAPVRGGLLVSTRRMRELAVDPGARTVRAGAGVVWSEVIAAAARHGLAPLCGSAPGVGVVGYTLGGGLSPVARSFGYTADHVRAVQIVTADGRVRWADAGHEPELFWAVRGGKGNFGVVTTIVLDLPAPAR
ncbi:FAD-binding protein, partial [Pseudonocardia sp. KRD291]|uniref:FAD-binding protein n=1 Tax=Pseudonocardia sp. KRD291 TaxID=2792007 RepID=UPI001C4A11CF